MNLPHHIVTNRNFIVSLLVYKIFCCNFAFWRAPKFSPLFHLKNRRITLQVQCKFENRQRYFNNNSTPHYF